MRSSAILTAGLALVVVATGRDASAFECTPSEEGSSVTIHWEAEIIPYGIQAPGPRTMSPSLAELLILESFNRWAEPDCTSLELEYRGVLPEDHDEVGVSKVVFVDADWPHEPTAVGLTTSTYRIEDGVIRDGVIELNEAFFRFADAAVECADDDRTYDLGAVVTHEAGHFFGLDHVPGDPEGLDPNEPAMSPVVQTCDARFRTLESDDVEGVCFIYPAGQTGRSCDQPEGGASGCGVHEDRGATAWSLCALAIGLGVARQRRARDRRR